MSEVPNWARFKFLGASGVSNVVGIRSVPIVEPLQEVQLVQVVMTGRGGSCLACLPVRGRQARPPESKDGQQTPRKYSEAKTGDQSDKNVTSNQMPNSPPPSRAPPQLPTPTAGSPLIHILNGHGSQMGPPLLPQRREQRPERGEEVHSDRFTRCSGCSAERSQSSFIYSDCKCDLCYSKTELMLGLRLNEELHQQTRSPPKFNVARVPVVLAAKIHTQNTNTAPHPRTKSYITTPPVHSLLVDVLSPQSPTTLWLPPHTECDTGVIMAKEKRSVKIYNPR